MSKADPIDDYLRLAQARQALRVSHPYLTPSMIAMLEELMFAHLQGSPLKITDAMHLADQGSPATVHRRLVQLRKRGYVQLVSPPTDTRVKYLIPTQLATDVFDRMWAGAMGSTAAD